jgi:hypothetical protein
MKLHKYLVLFSIAARAAFAGTIYDAGSGTLPQAQGWVYSGDAGNPAPFVSGGALHEVKNVVNTAQFWSTTDNLDVTQHIFLQADLRINSSNNVPDIGTGTRQGYYLRVSDANSLGYYIGISDAGFSINTIGLPNAPLQPYPIAGAFHSFMLRVDGGLADFSIDGVIRASGISPYFSGKDIAVNDVTFGALAGVSVSDSDLRFVCTTTSGTCGTATAIPEPSMGVLAGASILFLLLKRHGYLSGGYRSGGDLR